MPTCISRKKRNGMSSASMEVAEVAVEAAVAVAEAAVDVVVADVEEEGLVVAVEVAVVFNGH